MPDNIRAKNVRLSKFWGHSSVGRASDLHSEGQRFDPVRLHQNRGLAQSGSAPALGAGGRRFESYIPDHARVAQW